MTYEMTRKVLQAHPRVVGSEVFRVRSEGAAECGAAQQHWNCVCAVVAHQPRLDLALIDLPHDDDEKL
jgi:hypothetical protein